MTLETLRVIHLFRDGLATDDDPPAVIDALLRLRTLGARAEHLAAAGVCLRARPIVDREWLVVTVDAHAYRFSHCCLDDETAFETARVVQLKDSTVAPSDAEGATFLPVVPPPAASDRGAAGFTAPPGARTPGGSTFP